jgi:probable HAF family extracellular repeat protein
MMRQQQRRLLLLSFLVTAAITATGAQAAPPRYELTVLPDLAEDTHYTFASAINNKGQVTGQTGIGATEKTFVFADGKMSALDMPPGVIFSGGRSINDRGEIAGVHASDASEYWFLFVYRAGKVTLLKSLGYDDNEIGEINNAGQVVGTFGDYQAGRYHAFVYAAGKSVSLFPDTLQSNAKGINDSGQITGTVTTEDGITSAFIYREGKFRLLGGLGAGGSGFNFGGTASSRSGWLSGGTAINRWGHVVGAAAVGDRYHAFRYRGGVMTDLGVMTRNGDSGATSINDAGHVVGSWGNADRTKQGVFIYLAGRMHDLNALTAKRRGFELQNALDINNAGQIVGYGAYPGQAIRAFLLTPIRKAAAQP